MTLVLKDRVKETCTGTAGIMTLAGAVSGFVAFSVIGDTEETYYVLEDADATKWEVGIGTYTLSGTTFSRDEILANQAGTTATQEFSGGTHTIYCVYPAEKSVHLDGSGGLSHTVDLTSEVTGTLPVANGGTNLTSISTLLNSNVTPTSLSLLIGTNTQAYDADLTAIAGLSSADSNFIVGSAGGWVVEDGVTARASLGVDATGTDNSPTAIIAGLDYISAGGTKGHTLTLAQIDLTTDVSGSLPDGNIASASTWNAKQAALTFGIADTNAVKIDDADAVDNDYAKITATGLEGKSYNEVKIDLTLDSVENTALSTWVGTTNITTLGTVTGTATWNATAIGATYLPALDSITVPAGDVSLNSHKITSLTDPTSAQDAATKSYVDAVKIGLDVKASCRVATTAAGTLDGPSSSFENGDAIDGVTLATGDRILIKDQSTGSENGIYTVNASAGPTRATDFDTDAEVTSGAFTFVEEGTVNSDAGLVLTTNDPITLGSTALTFTQFSGAGQITAGTGLTKSGNTIDAVGTSNKIDVSADAITISPTYVGQTSITTLSTIATGTWEATNVAVAHGGTGSSTASGARTNLGVAIDSDVQAWDAQLDSVATWSAAQVTTIGNIGTITTADDMMIYTTAADTFAETAITAFGRSILGDANEAAFKTTVNLEIGTDVQAYDADLAAIAGLTSAADKGIQFTGAGTAATYDLTAAGKALLDDANAAAQLTTLGAAPAAGNSSILTVGALDSGSITSGFGSINNGSSTITTTGAITGGSLDVSDGNITNVGSIACDSVIVDAAATGLDIVFGGVTTTNKITLTDNLADALNIAEDTSSYMKFVTTNSSESIVFGQNSTFSGTTIADLGTVTTANIDGGTVDGADVTVGSGKTLDVSAGTLTTSAAQNLAIVQGAASNIDIGTFSLTANTLVSDIADGGASPLTVTSTTLVANLNADLLDGQEGSHYLAIGNTTGLGTNVGTFLATPSSSNLAAAITDETGTGALVFATSPTLVTPILGTPQSGDLANCTFPTLNQSTTATAAIATTVTVADESADATCFPLFVTAATGNVGPKVGTNLTFASDTGILSATGFAGPLTGNATTVTNGVYTTDSGTVSNTMLANSSITVSDGSNTSPVALGGTMTFSGTTNEVTVAESAGTVTIGLPDDVTISGDLTVNGTTTTVNSTTLSVADPLIILASGNDAADVLDIGFYGLYDTSGSLDLYAGLFRDANDSGKFKLFKDLQVAPTTTVNTSGTGYAKATLVADIEGALAGNAVTATTATNVIVSDSESDNSDHAITFVDDLDGSTSIGIQSDGDLHYNPSTGTITATSFAGTLTTAAQANITSVGALTALTVDDIALDGKVITMTGDTDDTAVFTAGTNGTLSIVTTDTAAAAANIQITADGAAELAGTTVTLDSSGGITLDADGGTISFADDGVSLGAITSSGYSGLAATATALAATGNIAATGHIAWDVDFSGSNVTAAATIQGGVVDNSMLAGSIANAKLVNDSVTVGTTEIDLGTSATTLAGLASVTSTAFVGALTGNATTVTNGVYTTDLGSNVLTFLGTPSSSNLAAAITGETGTGALVFGTSPTFTTSIKTPLIQDTDGDPAITINDGGSVQFEQASISAADLTNTATGSDPNMIISLDLATANFFRVQLGDGEDVTAINFTNPTIGQTFLIRFEQPASGTKATVVWTDVDAPDAENALVYWPGGVAPTLTETNSKSDMIGFVCTGSPSGSTMAFDGFIVGQNMSIPA